jgi:hypothetical protein
MNQIAEDYKKYLESINPIMQYERLKARQEKDTQFIERLQNAVNKFFIQHGTPRNNGKGNNQ